MREITPAPIPEPGPPGPVVTLEADEASRLASLLGALDLIIANYPNSWGHREMLQKVSGCLAAGGTIRVKPGLPVPQAGQLGRVPRRAAEDDAGRRRTDDR